MNKNKNKTKALKTAVNNGSGFFRALIFGLTVCAVVWLCLSLVFALVLSGLEDSGLVGRILSSAVAVISLLVGGFAAGKSDKKEAVLTSFILGVSVLAICFALSVVFDLSRNAGVLVKSIIIAGMLVCPVAGARLAVRKSKTKKQYGKYNVKKM